MIAQIQKLFRWILLVPVIVPLVYADGILYPYLAPKTLLLRGIGILAVAVFAYLVSAGAPFFWQRLKSKLVWIPAALLVVAYLVSAIGIDFYISFWSIFERGDGLLTLTVITAFFYLIVLSADRMFVSRLLTVTAWVASVVAIHAMLQWVSGLRGFSIPLILQTNGRLGGTLGNAAFLASYLGMTVIATLYAARVSSKRYKIILYVGAALQLWAITLTATRGTILALIVVGVAALAYLSFKSAAKTKQYSRTALGVIILVAILFIGLRGPLSHSSISPISRLASISLSDGTVSSRLFLWNNLTKEALPHALTGVGAEHITPLFDKVYDPSEIKEQWFDRSHNSFLDYFIQFGIFGFLLYAALVLASCYVGWRIWTRKGVDHLAGLSLLFITAVYAIQNMFVFDTGITLWLLVALFGAALVSERNPAPTALVRIPKGEWIGAGLAVAILLLIIPVAVQPLRANMYLADAYVYHVADVSRSIDSMQKGWALNTYANLEYGYEAYQMYTGEQLTQLNGADLAKAYKNADALLEANFKRYPYDARTATYLAHVLDSAPAGAATSSVTLEQAIDKAIELSPKRTQPWYLKANIYIQQGDAAKTVVAKKSAYLQAIDVLKQYIAVVPTLAEPRYVIASLYLVMNDKATAKQWADEGLANYTKPDGDQAGRAVKYYIAVEDWPHAVEFLQDIVDEYPTDYDSRYDLAKASYLSGDKTNAKSIVEMLEKEKPGFVDSDQAFLNALAQ